MTGIVALASAGVHTTEHVEALLRRSRRGAADLELRAETVLFWKGYTKGLEDLLNGTGELCHAKDAASAQVSQGSSAGACARLTDDTSHSAIQSDFSATEEIQLAGDHIAQGRLSATELLEDVAVAVIDILDDKHAVARRDSDDDRQAHGGSVGQLAELLGLAQRVARLNPKAGEIGAGMLANLVETANRVLGQQPGGIDAEVPQ